MQHLGQLVVALSLISIILTDFKYKKIYNLSLGALVVGLAIFMPSNNSVASIIRVMAAGLVLILLNLSLKKRLKTLIQPGDVKLILVLAWFFNVQTLSLVLLGGSLISIAILFSSKGTQKNRAPLGGSILVSFLIWLILNLS
jgi:Flp pilus assembly protein protease CpaA